MGCGKDNTVGSAVFYDDPKRAEIRAEEQCAVIKERPGNLFKLITALCFAAAAAHAWVRRIAASLYADIYSAVSASVAGSPVRVSLAPLGQASTATTLAIIGGIAALSAMAVASWYTPGLPEELDYASGDRPAVHHESDAACDAGVCGLVITATTLTWKLAATRPAIDTELRAIDGKPGRTAIGGELVLSSTRCPGTTVAWTVSANQARIATGVLTGNHRSQNLSYVTQGQLDDVTFQAKLTTPIRCDTTVEWRLSQ